MKNFLLLFFFFTHSAFATIWITLADPKSNKIGVVGASSGYIGTESTMVVVDNHGIAVVGSWYLDRGRDKRLYGLVSDQTLPATEVVSQMNNILNRGQHKRRVSFVNSRFENASMAGRRCHSNNNFCGSYNDNRFTIVGGGLVSEDVILKAKDVLLDPEVQKLPIECQLYLGIKAVFESGGERKRFKKLSFMVDDLGKNEDGENHYVFSRRWRRHENVLLTQFGNVLEDEGIFCPAEEE